MSESRYRLLVSRAARKQLDRLPHKDIDRINAVLTALREDPYHNARKLAGQFNLWRIRVGRLRIIYQIRTRELTVLVLRVAKRDERTYRNL